MKNVIKIDKPHELKLTHTSVIKVETLISNNMIRDSILLCTVLEYFKLKIKKKGLTLKEYFLAKDGSTLKIGISAI